MAVFPSTTSIASSNSEVNNWTTAVGCRTAVQSSNALGAHLQFDFRARADALFIGSVPSFFRSRPTAQVPRLNPTNPFSSALY